MMRGVASVAEAALNNAEWCDAFCRTHRVVGCFDEAAWSSAERTPPLYSDAVALAPGCSGESLISRVDAGPGCSIKDSFADLDLSTYGFDILFTAEWLCEAQARARDASQGWSAIADGIELQRWETAWGESVARPFFRSELLGDDRVRILARYKGGLLRAGAVANRSRGGVIGLTNVFDLERDFEAAWNGAATAAQAVWGGIPVVGYARGEALAAAHNAGFETIGSLTVWIKGS